MAQVTYRGVKYDSEEYRKMVQAAAQQRNYDLMYRGIKYDTDKRNKQTCTKSEMTYRGVKFQKELCNV